MKPKLLAIVGPTATGKSDLAVKLARRFDGEIISADSRQVYKGLDIGTGKITKQEMMGIPHHLLDVCDPKKRFSVSEFKKLADEKIKEIISRNKLPILCGGTGFYIDAVINNATLPEVPPNKRLRARLEKLTANKLALMLKKLDPKRFENIDTNNKVRMIRAIEIAKTLGRVPQRVALPSLFKTLVIGLDLPKEILQKKIHDRLVKRMRIGMVKEAQELHNPPAGGGVSWKRMEELGLEYRYLALFLQKKISKQEMIAKLETEIWHYAKRQKTWFKRNKNIAWFGPAETRKIEKCVKKFLA